MKIVKNIFFNIALIVASVVVLFVGVMLISGATGYAVVSKSMEPQFSKGDVIFSKKVDFEKLKNGDVITFFHGEENDYTTHRIIKIDSDRKEVLTKGDKNDSEDPANVEASHIVGKFWFSLPYFGYLSLSLYGKDILSIVAALAVSAIILRIIIANKRRNEVGAGNEKK